MTPNKAALADELERLCYAETEGKFLDCVTDNLKDIVAALRAQQGGEAPSKEWCLAAARHEGDIEIGAGWPAPPAIAPVASAPTGDDVRELVARTLYECERSRAEHCQSVLQKASGKECPGAAMEPWSECSEVFLSDADAVLAALPASAGVEGWRDISTALRDGRDILLFDPEDGCVVAFYRESKMNPGPLRKFIWQLQGDGGVLAEQVPTHWMPLPPSPNANPTENKGE